jgi:hypothetical protein
VGFEWIELPAEPVRAGAGVTFAGKPRPGWDVGLIEVRFEPPPRQLTRSEVTRRGSYGYPPAIVRTSPPEISAFPTAQDRSDLERHRGGWMTFRFRLDHGPGYYFVLCYLRRTGAGAAAMTPATAAMVTAVG